MAAVVALTPGNPPGATPLDPDEAEGLRVPAATRDDLNALEQVNILDALRWLEGHRRRTPDSVADPEFLRTLHGRMLSAVWRWAGAYRATEKNIGCAPHDIAPRVRELCDDVKYWVEHRTHGPTEIAVRFHHRLTAIHPFANGNGRHARLATDVLLEALGSEAFTWGPEGTDLDVAGPVRDTYLEALRAADAGDYQPLLAFVRARPVTE
jgi:Fic-DOC domain mobile mystery protein B